MKALKEARRFKKDYIATLKNRKTGRTFNMYLHDFAIPIVRRYETNRKYELIKLERGD